MLLFCRSREIIGGQVIIPSERIYNIMAVGCRVNINYDGGELMEVRENVYQPKIETASILYDSSDEVDKIIRQFYKSVSNNSNCFYFGGSN